MAHTYLVEVTPDQVWFGRLGKGGAHWDPDYLAMAMAANGLLPFTQLRLARQIAAISPVGAGAALGKVIGDKVLAKYNEEIAASLVRFGQEGRPALAGHKATFETTRIDLAQLQPADKVPPGAPPALKGCPAATVKLDGKTWFVFEIPGATTLADFTDLVVRGH